MTWRVAPSIRAALDEANRRWPNRNRASDGTIGDQNHTSRSDHSPCRCHRVVHAFDLTHDPANGADCHQLAEHLRTTADPRVKYVIWNRRIWNPSISNAWRTYTGANPHDRHMHVSIHLTRKAEEDTAEWWDTPTRTQPLPFVTTLEGEEEDVARFTHRYTFDGKVFVTDLDRRTMHVRDGDELGVWSKVTQDVGPADNDFHSRWALVDRAG
jgi:hypothetical protein